jgi:type II secretory pathway pseudopilin PulG
MCHDRGYAMAALLVAMSVMAVLLTVALPTWKHTLQREKEEELIFRGGQYSRAIAAYQRKYANASPRTLDVLIEQHYLRKKFKDPLAVSEDGEFAPLYVVTQTPGSGGPAGSSGSAGRGGQSSTGGQSSSGRQTGSGRQSGSGGSMGNGGQNGSGESMGNGGSMGSIGQIDSGGQSGASSTVGTTTPSGGGIIGVASKNPGQSIREYNGHTHYNEWQFIPLQQSTRGGGPGGAFPGPGRGPGGPGRGTGAGSGGPGSGAGPGGAAPGGAAPRGQRGGGSGGGMR